MAAYDPESATNNKIGVVFNLGTVRLFVMTAGAGDMTSATVTPKGINRVLGAIGGSSGDGGNAVCLNFSGSTWAGESPEDSVALTNIAVPVTVAIFGY